jgi:hypothetical protein
MLPLYSDDDAGHHKSTFRIRQRASTPGGRTRRRPPTTTPDGDNTLGGSGVWEPQRVHRVSLNNETAIMMPDDDDDDIESAASATTRTARSTHGGPHMQQYPTQQQILSHRRPTNTTTNQQQYLRHSHSYNNHDPPHYQHQAGFVKSWKIDYEYGLDDYHTVFRTPHFVTDAEYQKHLRGELFLVNGPSSPFFSGNKLSSHSTTASSSSPPIISNVACANFCFVLSLVATIILTFFGLLLDTQALYIPGTLPAIPVQSTVDVHGHIRNQQVYEYLIPDTERLPIATTAYRTAGLYFLCAISAFYYLHRHGGPNGSYTSIPETSSLPTFVSHAAHNDSLWQRMVRRIKRHTRYRRNKMQEKKG